MRLLPILILLASLMVAMPSAVFSQPVGDAAETPELMLDRLNAEAELIEQAIEAGITDRTQVEAFRDALEAHRRNIPGVMKQMQARFDPLREQLGALSAAPEDTGTETDEIAVERKRLTEQVSEGEALNKRFKQADARAVTLLSQLAGIRRAIVTKRLLTRGPSIFEAGATAEAVISIRQVAGLIAAETREQVSKSRMDTPFFIRVLLPLALIGVALFLVVKVQRSLMERLTRHGGDRTRLRAVVGFVVTLVRLFTSGAALALVSFAIWNSGFLGPQGEVLLAGITRALGVVIIAYALGGAFYAPRLPEFRLSSLSDPHALAAQRWLMTLAGVAGLDLLFVVHGDKLGLSFEGLDLFNTMLLLIGGLALWNYAGFLDCGPPRVASESEVSSADDDAPTTAEGEFALGPILTAITRSALRVAALAAPVLALMGFFAASRTAFYPVVFSGAVIAAGILIVARVRDVVSRAAERDQGSGDAADSGRTGLIPMVVGFILLCAGIPILALIWGADSADLENSWRAFADGFKVGEAVVSPLVFFSFLLVFTVGYLITRLIQGVLGRSFLPLTGLDVGGRALVRAGVFYVGVILSALIAISTTGLDLSNLAIVAGALSVGIGFGLQNIVNNFVSGIILLIERPIKEGDWVELSSGTGYVSKVNVRSTEIQTFDRASLFVPNSELISGAVTNWTHSNLNGRLIVPVGAAYGNDPKKIEDILLGIAKANSELLRHPAPYVLFRRFGADALEFEIRAVLRDVNWILNVTSDINHEISRRFAEEGIEIPFAQRDLHIRNPADLGQSIGDAIRGGQPPQTAQETDTTVATPAARRNSTDAAGFDSDGDS